MQKLTIFEALSNTSCFRDGEVEQLISSLSDKVDFKLQSLDQLDVRKKLANQEHFPDATADFTYNL